MIHHGDCLEVMARFDPGEVDAIVTDPPYGLGFMGKAWDHGAPGIPFWAEMLRVAKPGAHLLAFGGTRTVHRMTTAIEDAGWEIRDCLVWAYASGFPKSHNLSGDWQGWGTALKPAWEPIVMARKPLRGTVATNVATFGTGALNVDGTRIATSDVVNLPGPNSGVAWRAMEGRPPADRPAFTQSPAGRWPANVILTDPIFDGGVVGVVGGGDTTSGLGTRRSPTDASFNGGWAGADHVDATYGDSGTYSRFFLIPKADRGEREPVGLAGFEGQRETVRRNVHPTVKPVDLMRHLVRLVTPPGGIVLDPFLGSGTTGIACEMEGFDWIGIEKEAEYVAIAEARLHGVQQGMGLSA